MEDLRTLNKVQCDFFFFYLKAQALFCSHVAYEITVMPLTP